MTSHGIAVAPAQPPPAIGPAARTRQAAEPGRLTTATLLLASTLTVMAGATIAPALPAIAAQYADVPGIPLLVGQLLTLPAGVIALAIPFAGAIADRFDRRRLLVAALALYVAGGTTGLWVDAFSGLLAGRVLLGLAVAVIMTTATALIADLYPPERRRTIMLFQSAAMSFGGLVFLSVGGVLAERGWRGPFSLYAAAGLLVPMALLGLRGVGTASRPAGGTATSIPLRAWPVRAALLLAATSTVFYVVPTRLPFLLLELGLASARSAGFAIALSVFASGVTALTLSRAQSVASPRAVVSAGFLCLGVGLLGVGWTTSFAVIVLSLFVSGVGLGVVAPTLMNIALGGRQPAFSGRFAGLMTGAMFGGQFLSPLAAGVVERRFGLGAAFVAVGCGAVIMAAVSILLLRPAASTRQ